MTRAQALELLVLTMLAAAGGAGLLLGTGHWGWSWDALNHHVYLGMTAESPRWHLDVIPASYQTYQYPYLYWPVYRLSLWDTAGATAGAVWAAFQAVMLLLPVWWISLRLLPTAGRTPAQAVFERSMACALAFMSSIVLIGLETTANDLLAAVPLLWAVAVMLHPSASSASTGRAAAAGALWGMAAAFKLSNGIFLPLLLLWWWVPQRPWFPLRRGLAIGAGAVLGFAATYLPWGWQLWQLTGNPFYPFLGQFFGGG